MQSFKEQNFGVWWHRRHILGDLRHHLFHVSVRGRSQRGGDKAKHTSFRACFKGEAGKNSLPSSFTGWLRNPHAQEPAVTPNPGHHTLPQGEQAVPLQGSGGKDKALPPSAKMELAHWGRGLSPPTQLSHSGGKNT